MNTFKQSWRLQAVAVIGILILSASAQAKKNSFVCRHPDKPGGWGALDLGCDADQFGDISRIEYIYPKFVFDRRAEGIAPTEEYVTNINAIIRQVAYDYYTKRVPNPKPATLEAWMRSAVAIGAHESMLSHYRIAADGRYKLMTGDHLVSHGIMQVNQEFHANKELDSSFDLVGNIVSALDTYFAEWNASIKTSCFAASNGRNPTLSLMLQHRAQSAYSAYNGGPRKLCRYTNPRDVYSAHDKHFFAMLKDRPWTKFITDPNRRAPINVQCIIDGDDMCAMAAPQRALYMKSRPLLLKDGRTCVTTDGTNYTCATDSRILTCLSKIDPDMLENDPLRLDKPPANAHLTMVTDREPLCTKAVEGLLKVGTMIIIKKQMVMRETIGGSPLSNTRVGRIYQVQDYDLRLGGKTERYYKIKTSGGLDGWIFGGENADHAEWIQVATASDITAAADAVKAQAAAKAKAIADAKAAELARAAAAAAAAKVKAEAKAKADAQAKADAEAAAQPDIVVTAPRQNKPPVPTNKPAVTTNKPVETKPEVAKPEVTNKPVTTNKPAVANKPATPNTVSANNMSTPAHAAPIAPPVTSPVAIDQPKPVVAPPANDDADDEDTLPVLPVKGSIIEITRVDGIVLRATPGESADLPYVDQLYKGARLVVEDVVTKGSENCIYLQVTQGGKTGWIYVGRTHPDVTISKWIKLWN